MTTLDIQLNGSQRPKSAVDNSRFASQSLGRLIQSQSAPIDEKTVGAIWKGFGSYLAKQLRNGKGVFVPRLGNFTFSAAHGTTNPQERDHQIREPVFIIGKDFVSAVTLKTGVAHNRGSQIRPYDIKGASGIIPKVKINYTEVAQHCDQTKDICRNGCEQVFRFLSDKVRKGESVSMDIPYVGQFIVRGNIAAVAFLQEVQEETKGVTAKGHFVNKLFASSVNRMNLVLHDQSLNKQNPSLGLGGAMRLTGDAENWLKSNLNINVQELIHRGPDRSQRVQSAHPIKQMNRYGSLKPEDLKKKSWAIETGLTEQNKQAFDKLSESRSGPVPKRPMSAYTGGSRGSKMSVLPEIGRMKLMIVANEVLRSKAAIIDLIGNGKGSLRDELSSSEIQQGLKKVGIYVEIGHLKALFRELGFNFNGKSCSYINLFEATKQFISGSGSGDDQSRAYFQTAAQGNQYDTAPADSSRRQGGRSIENLIQMVKDLFYSTRKSLYELYSEARLGANIDLGGFRKIINNYSGNRVSEQDIQNVFNKVAQGKDQLSYQEFDKAFKWDLPAGGEWETRTVKVIREWMFKTGLSSETTFELFLKQTGKVLQKKLNRQDFHKAMASMEFGFSAPEIDGLFNLLDSNDEGELDVQKWKARIYEDVNNPLQMLREVVNQHKISVDDLLFKMQLRIWDAPLDFPKLCEALRKLDQSMSESQVRFLAKSLKNKDDKVEISSLLRNLCGQEYETVDYRNKIFRKIYDEVHPHKEQQLLNLLEEADPMNDGKVEPIGLKQALSKVVTSVDQESIDRFVRFLDKDKFGKIKYVDFLARMSEVSNRDHNPFKSVVQRLAYFIDSNKQTIPSILKRLTANLQGDSSIGVPVGIFASFLKAKVDKKRSESELKKYAFYMDIDKDGLISEVDLQTCLNHLNSDAFFKNSGEALASSAFASAKKFFPQNTQISEEKSADLARQIREAMITQKIAYREAFNRFDSNQDGFLSFTEFSQGIDKILTLSPPIKEKLFSLMDRNKIGLVDYPHFLEVIQLSSAKKLSQGDGGDNFDWEEGVIEQIKQWIQRDRITVEEAFKCFDQNFDGVISKDDLKLSLVSILQIKPEEIFPTKIDRLFRLMDFYKTNAIQLSDFQRLMSNQNPYSAATGSRMTKSAQTFARSLGGGFTQASTFDWKLSAIQQMGLIISKKFPSVKQSFEVASEKLQKVTFEQFKKFVDQHQGLAGFNMTLPLIQKLFAEMDPHKKGYLTETDWVNALQSFNWNDQILIELKNAVQCSFADCDSAFQFFLTFKDGNAQSLSQKDFEKAVDSLLAGRFKQHELQSLWKHLSEGKVQSIDRHLFRQHFDNIKYTGSSSIRNIKSALPIARTTIVSASSSSTTWDVDIFEKVRQIIRTSTKSFADIFKEFDQDGNGYISQVEFRQAIRKLQLGLTSKEIDKLMEKIDTNQDGKISWQEFINKFKTNELDGRLKERAKDKMARLKELMILHMTSPNDAFRFFDESKLGKLSYQEFAKLTIKAHELAGDKVPAYPVIKDLFDTIDIRKDGTLDINEWQQTFGNVTSGSNKLTVRATPLSLWENSREFSAIGNAIAKNRKILREAFDLISDKRGFIISFDQAKQAMDGWLNQNFKGLGDDKLKCVLRVAELQGANADGIGNSYDYSRLLDVYKSRHAGPQV